MSFLRKYEVWCFLGLIVVVNTLFISAIMYDFLPEAFYMYGRFALLIAVLFSVIVLARGSGGLVDLFRPLIEWQRPLRTYMFALFWNPLFCLILLSVVSLIKTGELPVIPVKYTVITRLDVIALILVSSCVGEIVWISYAVRRLSAQFTAYVSAVIVGAVWTAWWTPMVFYNFGIIPDLPLMALLLNQIGVAAICTFVYAHTKSGIVILCAQLSFNFSILIFPVTPADGGTSTYWIFAISYFCAALMLFLIAGPKPLLMKGAGRQLEAQNA
jgi:hypothetical protein